MIKDAKTVVAKVSRGCELLRGNFCGWTLYRGDVKIARVSCSAAESAIESGRLVRVDDRTSVVGETWAAKAG
jgi:hypothetical protein